MKYPDTTYRIFVALSAIICLCNLTASSVIASEKVPQSGQRLGLRQVIQATLAKQPAITVAKEQLQVGSGFINLALADFDWKFDAGLTHDTNEKPTGASLLYDRLTTTALDLRFNKKTKYGFSLEPGLTFKTADVTAAQGSGIESTADNTLRLFFNLNVPLLQGAGQQVTTARESSARYDYEAIRYELLHSISLAASDTIIAYWDYMASYERLKHARAVEKRAGSVVVNTESLVNADEIPKAELVAAQANHLEKKITLENAELTLIEARQKLGLVSGAAADETGLQQLPTDPLPIITQTSAKNALISRKNFIEYASNSRGDLLALNQKTKALELLLLAANDATNPKLDLIMGIGYDGYQTGHQVQRIVQTVEYRQKSPDWSIGLRFSFPIENHGAKGSQAIVQAQLNQARIRQFDMRRTIETSINTVLLSMQNIAREIEKTDQTVTAYQKSVENEQEKYLMGESTLFDLLFMQDKLESAQLSRIDAQYRGAVLLTRLQFESGKMLDCRTTECEFNANSAAVLIEPPKRIYP